MKQITLQYKRWSIKYSVKLIGNEYKHTINIARDNKEISHMEIWSKRKTLYPELFYECRELYMNSPHWRELCGCNNTIWEDEIMPKLVELAKDANKKKKE